MYTEGRYEPIECTIRCTENSISGVQCLLLVFLAISSLHSQEEDSQRPDLSWPDRDWVDINAPQLSEAELLWINAITASALAEQYEEAIDFLARHIQDGLVSSADYLAVAVLRRIALYPHIIAGGKDPPILQRQRSIQLLGRLGGEESLSVMDEILTVEDEITLLNALFLAYKDIAPPFNNIRSKYFARHLRRANLVAGNEGLILSILSAVESMHRRTRSMNDEELFAEILAIGSSGKSHGTEQRALRLARLIVGIDIETIQN